VCVLVGGSRDDLLMLQPSRDIDVLRVSNDMSQLPLVQPRRISDDDSDMNIRLFN
jgi:hypothetical protein